LSYVGGAGLLDPCDLTDAPISPEQRLFRHIILNAVLDAIYGATTCTRPEAVERAREEAMRWLVSGGEDFRTVCECANLEPTTVRDRALEYVARERHARLTSKMQRPRIGAHTERAKDRR
jgi:hypothetical protein